MDDTNQSDKNQKMVLKSIAKWLVIFALIAFVCYKNQDLMQEALEEIQITPVWNWLCVCCSEICISSRKAVSSAK